MFESGRKKGPHKNLFVADEHRGVLVVNTDCSTGKWSQWYAAVTKRFPHCDRNGNPFLIELGAFLPASKQDIQVAILRERIIRGTRSIDTSSEKDGAVLR